MDRGAKTLTAMVLGLSFTLAVLCSARAASARSFASVSGCLQPGHAMEMADCEQYFCTFGRASNVLSESLLRSVRSNDFIKTASSTAVGDARLDASRVGIFRPGKGRGTGLSGLLPKVSVHLVHSTLNL